MIRLFALSSLTCLSVLAADAKPAPVELSQVQTVYLLPMGNGMDQFIAHQLTRQGIFKVTTDPARADAFFSDVVGLGFENRLAELLPKVEAPVEEASKDDKDKKDKDDKYEEDTGAARVQTFARSKGNIFLIDVKSRRVLWTGFDIPKNTRSEELYKMGERLVNQLRKDLGGK